jgi:hypothetical protein
MKNTIATATAKYTKASRKVGMDVPTYWDEEDFKVLLDPTRRSTSYIAIRLREQREFIASRTKPDTLSVSHQIAYARQCRIAPTSDIQRSGTLQELISKLRDNGDPVALRIDKAFQLKHAHSRKMPGNYFSIREKEGMISYLPKGRQIVITEAGRWARDGRQEMKPAKWAKSILAGWQLKQLTDPDFANFAAKFAVEENASKLTVELVDGIDKVYGLTRYDTTKVHEVVSNSCMQGKPVGEFYSLAGTTQVLAIWNGNGILMGRAIYWPKVTGGGVDGPAIDRIYGTVEVQTMAKAWADENGVAYHQNQGMGYSDWNLRGERLGTGGYISTPESVCDAEFYPYMDTFSWQDSDGDLTTCDDDASYKYESQYGCRSEINRHEGEVQLHNGDWVDEDDACYVSSESAYYAIDDVVTCHRSGEYILRQGAYEIQLGRNNTIHISSDYVTELD